MERILVVDNDESARLALAAVLESQGFTVETARCGADVLDQLAAGTVCDLIVSDIQMPGMDGIELARRVTDVDANVVTILMTGFPDRSKVLDAMRAGAFDFLWKPYTAAELDQVMDRARDRRKQLVGSKRHRERLEQSLVKRDSELAGTQKMLAGLHRLSSDASQPDQIPASLDDFARYALQNFGLTSFGILILEENGLEPLVFRDRFGRTPAAGVLPVHSELCQAVARHDRELAHPPASWYLQPENRYGKYWPMRHDLFAGVLYAGSDQEPEVVPGRHEAVFRVFASQIDGFLREHYMTRRHQKQQRHLFVGSIQAHARAIEAKDPYTAGHCDRVERYTEVLARHSGEFSAEGLFKLRVGAILHDIGKIGVPSALLCKPGVLDADEQRQVRSHPVIGGRIVRSLEGFDLEPSVRHHHEQFDGKGYPDRLKGDQIPLEARLILAADTFDAMTSNRPYHRALATERALEELQAFSGKQFDPEVVRLMNAARSELETARQESTVAPHALEGLREAV